MAVVSAATNESDAAASDSARDMRFVFMARMRGYIYIYIYGLMGVGEQASAS